MIPNRKELERFYELHDKYYHHFITIGLRYGWAIEDLKDIISQTFLDLIEKNIQITNVINPQAYLTTVFKRKLIDNARKNSRELTELQKLSLQTENEIYREQKLEEDPEATQKIRKAFLKLPPRCQKVIFLKFYKGLSSKEIAQQTGISTRSVYNNLFEALKLLKENITQKDIAASFSLFLLSLLFSLFF